MINFRFLFSFTIILYFVIIIDKECTTFQIKFFRKIFIIISNFFVESLYYYGQKVKQLTRYYYMHICIYVNIPLYLILECSALPRIRYFRKKKKLNIYQEYDIPDSNLDSKRFYHNKYDWSRIIFLLLDRISHFKFQIQNNLCIFLVVKIYKKKKYFIIFCVE